MTVLLSATRARMVVDTKLNDTELETLTAELEAEVVRFFGANYVDASTTVTFTKRVFGQSYLYLPRKVSSITSVTEEDATLTEDEDFELSTDQSMLYRLPYTGVWYGKVVVTYVPYDDNEDRKKVILDLLRLDLARTAMSREDFDGSYNYAAPEDWDVERAKILRRLKLTMAI